MGQYIILSLHGPKKNGIGNNTKVKRSKHVNHVHETHPILNYQFILPQYPHLLQRFSLLIFQLSSYFFCIRTGYIYTYSSFLIISLAIASFIFLALMSLSQMLYFAGLFFLDFYLYFYIYNYYLLDIYYNQNIFLININPFSLYSFFNAVQIILTQFLPKMIKQLQQRSSIPNELLDDILHSYPELQYQEKQILKKTISEAKICKALIRQNIIQEGMNYKKGILILAGTLLITKKVAHGRIVFSQLNYLQIANIQIFLYKRAHYTATVHTSELKYIQVPESTLKILFDHQETVIMNKQNARNEEVDEKMREVSRYQKLKQKQKMIDRLSLPAIKYLNQDIKQSNSQTSLTRKLKKSNSQVDKNEKSQSPKNLKKNYSLPKRNSKKNLDLKPIQIQKKTIAKQSIIEQGDRNQRIFKQQLKTIIKRKLIYERKQLGVLKAYRHDNHYDNDKVIVYEEDPNYIQPEGTHIDQYFKF